MTLEIAEFELKNFSVLGYPGPGGTLQSVDPLAAIRHIFIDFENDSISPMTTWSTNSIAVVTNNPFDGTKSARGNLAHYFVTNDPITGLPRNSSPLDLDIAGITANASRTWDKLFFRYKMRFDDAENKGSSSDAVDSSSKPKLGYFSTRTLGEAETQSAIYPTLERIKGIAAMYRNGTGSADPTPDWPAGSIYGECADCGFDYTGLWNNVECLFDNVAHTFELWINDVKFIDTLSAFNGGVYPVKETFRFDHFRFFHASSPAFDLSVNRSGEKGGFQIDNIEVWQGDPRG